MKFKYIQDSQGPLRPCVMDLLFVTPTVLGAGPSIGLQREPSLAGTAITAWRVDTIVGTQLSRELGTHVFSCTERLHVGIKHPNRYVSCLM